MTDQHPLESLYEAGFGRPNPGGRFDGLRAALEAAEEAISHQADQFAVREHANRKRQGIAEDLNLPDLSVLHVEARETFAKTFRGGLLISTWATFESCIKDLGEQVRQRRNVPFGLQDLRAGDFLGQSEKFFRATLEISPFPDKADRKHLEQLKNLRNLLVHHDGSATEAPSELLKTNGMVVRVTDYYHDYVTPTAQYNRESLELAARVSTALAEKLCGVLYPQSRDA